MKRAMFAMIALTLLVSQALAAEKTTGGSRGSALDSLGSITLGLLAVLAVIFFSAWLVRRLQGLQGPSSNAVKVIAVLPVGQRERVTLLQVGKTQLLVGITTQSIRTLHVFDEPVVDPDTAPPSDFASRLQAVMGASMKKNKQGDSE